MADLPAMAVVARDAKLRDGDGRVLRPRLLDLLNRGLCRLGGVRTPREFWPLFMKPTDIVGIKVNCLAGRRLSTTVDLVEAIAQSVAAGGIPAENLVVWDRTGRELAAAGFPLRDRGPGWRCYGTDRVGYETAISESGVVGSCLSRLVTEVCSVLINVGVVKDHDLAGVSIGMKNLYGLLHNPNKYHDNVCDPYVADVANFPVVRRKLRLTIADGTLAQCHGGPAYSPGYAWNFNGLVLGADPVSVDSVGCSIIEARRKALGLPSLAEAKRWPVWLATAERYGLGRADPAKIRRLEEGDGM